MTKTKLAILGVGRWGKHLVRNFSQHPQAELLAVVETNPDKLAACRQQFGETSQVIFTEDWQTIRQHPELEAVVIATPASTHYALIKDALELGYHIFTEKPLTLDPEECRQLCELAANQQRQLFVDHTYLFNPAVEGGKQVVDEGTLGKLYYGYGARTHLSPVRQDVDALWDLAIHDIAIFSRWLGEVPTEVQATGTTWLQPELNMTVAQEQVSGLRDLVWVTLYYPSGFTAYVHLCWLNTDKQRRLTVVGDKGSLVFDELAESPLMLKRGYFEKEGQSFTPKGVETEVVSLENYEPLREVCDRFLECVQTDTPSPVSSGWVGTELVKILTALTRSLQTGGAKIPVQG
ncbi:Gfo/Idh/MocA family oxidoreductase [Spirulina sp. CS-785/01]|uniref:Gfo/Idh/MocA family protein n=1 Tax=Spirulina sp. CS-785/01 TaxID=3021716 RepID=UPI00232B6473|nr:Gfo/Idh/MocA family oxidoreductase [Spirulina sp. CS-785/01]MDB9314073.1 Gfo/Idh/MocA family oxidoreductase [Spirulina sp. CS-785/01]